MSRNYESNRALFPWIEHPPWRIPSPSSDAGPEDFDHANNPHPQDDDDFDLAHDTAMEEEPE